MHTTQIKGCKKLEVVKNAVQDPSKIKGSWMFGENLYNNVFICARKFSGKTNLIFNIIKTTCDKNTTVIVFSSTHFNDSTWGDIKHLLEIKKIPNFFFDQIKVDGIDQLQGVVESIKSEDRPPEETEESESQKKSREELELAKDVERILGIGKDDEEIERPPRPPKKVTPRFLFVFDDLSTELKSKSIDSLLKQNRHYKARVIISSQWLNDLTPSSRRQIQTYILFGGHSIQKMEELYANADLSITFEELMEYYTDATKERYNFLYIDSDRNELRKNFDCSYSKV
jgi:hypothetical protein